MMVMVLVGDFDGMVVLAFVAYVCCWRWAIKVFIFLLILSVIIVLYVFVILYIFIVNLNLV